MKHDLKKDPLYRPGRRDFVEVHVPPARFLAVDGHGDPNAEPGYPLAVEALFTTAYASKVAFRFRTGDDFVVGPLEGLWSSGIPESFADGRKGFWDWTMLIPLPSDVSEADVDAGLAAAAAKKPDLPRARLIELDEGRCLQILHVGSYDDEAPTLERLHGEVMPALGVTFNGAHHEIYLGDPRRTAPERLRTILRQPIRAIV